jgi:hypothetical protein
MKVQATAVFTASRSVGNPQSAVLFMTAYLDRRAEFLIGIHSPTLAALHAGRVPLWDRQAIVSVMIGGQQ